MSWYREVYLQSDDWKHLRTAVVNHPIWRRRCFLCRRKKPLDAHHIRYKKLWNVKSRDLVPLCRECHDEVHEFIKTLPSSLGKREQWYCVMESFCSGKFRDFQRMQYAAWRVLGLGFFQSRRLYKKWPQHKTFLDKFFPVC